MRVTGFDHLVLNVQDVERSLEFYSGTLGLAQERVAEWRAGEVSFPSVRVNEFTIIDLLGGSRGGSNVDHFCLVVEPLDWRQAIESGALTVLEGPVARSGARGTGQSVYVEDPDGNVIELRWYAEDAE
ncbi:VOC family virulence protein [Actinomadura darangshiensis]|uniref:VOC family virulence protein n=1 Tax=Actinomadura darangshiensis TaxID=705336 RepID=A0A4R5A5V6_9ACTN|nr:VOC family protein [Actinomadura darangshiensis]TDD66965.1 VOC family virulence protein [Actinomadura darangshiensis]